MKLNYQDRSNSVWSMTKARQDNDTTYSTCPLKFEKKLNYHVRFDKKWFITKTKQGNDALII